MGPKREAVVHDIVGECPGIAALIYRPACGPLWNTEIVQAIRVEDFRTSKVLLASSSHHVHVAHHSPPTSGLLPSD